MRKSFKAFAVASAILTGLAFASALHAHESQEPGSSMMGSNKMGQDSMMNMMGQMSEMMEGCNRMMQSMNQEGSERPNEQWREKSPDTNSAPESNG